ncbi:transporter [uncultured Hymenobacter sp.]|uniref:transporter n=1 Tax=uncultured Hymenobacter sp. TaxID=170016 RepID=UPI0035CA5DD6
MKNRYLLLGLLLAGFGAQAQAPADTLNRTKQGTSDNTQGSQRQLRPLNADRPGVTESPNTIDPGHIQLETDLVRLINSKPGQLPRDRILRLNALAIRVGISDKTEVQAFIDPYTVEKTWEPGEPMERHAGFGDVALRVKHNFIGDDDEKERLVVAVIGLVRLPTGGREGAGGYEYGVFVPATYNLKGDWHVSAQAASFLSYDREEKKHFVELAPSFALDHGLNKWLAVFTEFATRYDLKDKQWISAINLGPIFHITERLQMDFGRRFALSQSATREYYVGLVIER